MNATILPEAELELQAAFDWYESQKRGLGHDLIDDFRKAVDLIVRFPTGWNRISDHERQYRLKRFPYGIVYRIERDPPLILITAFFHLQRNPEDRPSR
jgi:plasmid stabilization system protein ParE